MKTKYVKYLVPGDRVYHFNPLTYEIVEYRVADNPRGTAEDLLFLVNNEGETKQYCMKDFAFTRAGSILKHRRSVQITVTKYSEELNRLNILIEKHRLKQIEFLTEEQLKETDKEQDKYDRDEEETEDDI